jgi:hypothetical protein
MDIPARTPAETLARRALLNAVMRGLIELRRLETLRVVGTKPRKLLN